MRVGRWAWVAVCFVIASLQPALAHPGGLNSSGCHNNRRTGDYHCHRAPAVRPAPRATPAKAPRATKKAPSTTRMKPIARSRAARAAFVRANPCPINARTSGPCPGWEVDHIVPLACGGPDTPTNMQWLTTKENRRKGSMGCRRR